MKSEQDNHSHESNALQYKSYEKLWKLLIESSKCNNTENFSLIREKLFLLQLHHEIQLKFFHTKHECHVTSSHEACKISMITLSLSLATLVSSNILMFCIIFHLNIFLYHQLWLTYMDYWDYCEVLFPLLLYAVLHLRKQISRLWQAMVFTCWI